MRWCGRYPRYRFVGSTKHRGDLPMKESAECTVRVGFRRSPKKIFDEVDAVTAAMVREGWRLCDSVLEDGLGSIHLFFERELVTPSVDVHFNNPEGNMP